MSGSLADACWWTLARSGILCLVAWPIIVGIERWMRSLADGIRPLAIAALLVPFLFPELLVGYAYRNIAMAHPKWAEGICAGLLFIRIVPVGVVTLLASPATFVSSTAIHCRWMLLRSNSWSLSQWWQMLRCYLNGPVRRALPALGLMSIVAFQEFELAALLQTTSWTDWFIAAQRVGLDRNEMISQAAMPVLFQLPFLLGAFIWFARADGRLTEQYEVTPIAVSRLSRSAAMFYSGCALVFGGLVPFCVMAWKLPGGLILMTRQSVQWMGLGREMLIAATISVTAGTTAWLIGVAWAQTTRVSTFSVLIRYALLLPGLVGSLLLSLSTVALFQLKWLPSIYDTPIPWASALIVWLIPRAVLLRLWVGKITHTESVQLAQMLLEQSHGDSASSAAIDRTVLRNHRQSRRAHRSRALLFRLRDQPQLLAIGLLCYWAYLDLSTAYLLAPSGLSSGLVRLCNFMHFGRSAALSAESFLFFGAPLLATYLVIQIVRLITWLRTNLVGSPSPSILSRGS